MSEEDEEDPFDHRKEFIDDELEDNLSLDSLTEFRGENYHLSHLSSEPVTSTPDISLSTSPKNVSKGGKVKALTAIYEISDPGISFIAERTRGRMGSKIPRYLRVFDKFEVEVKRVLEDLERAIGTDDIEKIEDWESELRAHKSSLQTDMDRMDKEVFQQSELDDIVNLEYRAKMLQIKITKAIDKANKKTQIIKPVTTPMTAGKVEKLDIPEFDGDCTKYKFFSTRFKVLTAVFDEVSTKIYLTEKLRGRAYEYVKDLILQDAELVDIWKALDSHFGNQQNVIDATVKAYFELTKPIKDINKFEDFFVQSKNRAASVIDLGHSPEELLAAYFMLQIPGEYRSEIEKKLSINRDREKSTSTRYKFADLSPLVDEFVRIMKMASQNDNETGRRDFQNMVPVKAMLGATHNTYETNYTSQVQNGPMWEFDDTRGNHQTSSFLAQSSDKQGMQYNRGRGCNEGYSRGRGYNEGQGRGYSERYNQNNQINRGRGNDYGYNRGSYSRGASSYPVYPNYFCQICSRQHWTNRCDVVKNGPEMRGKLKTLNRCDVCLTEKDRHGSKCSEILSPCRSCRSFEHQSITCDGSKHPGSWLLK